MSKILSSRKYYNGQHYFLDEENQVIKLEENFHRDLLKNPVGSFKGFKKIGGSSIGNALNLNQFNNEFLAFCHIARLSMPVLDPKYVNAGVAIEPKMIDLLEKRTQRIVKTFPAQEYNYDYFKHKHDILGGIPDGYIESQKIVIEIKTAGEAKQAQWEQYGIPSSYLKQAQLYSHLMGANHYAIAAVFLKEEDYKEPNNVDVSQRNTLLKIFPLDKTVAEDDIKKVVDWFELYSKKGISPRYEVAPNKDLIEYLSCKNYDEWFNLYLKWRSEGKIVENE
ncbi:MAGa7180 family putative nuclease [Mycoplasma phocoenae]|uniref:YqaJ viral recombinase family protein n=1 Tax=Mycoplasma phocoenae TaxID=754517 RepID=A0A858U986_9MOLU|nr:YqaJ viral recombinase family protein [Mycoplasma phocoenae]QJG67256.1 YqaJ viral recombinase family protein [Mycoplasma phocoenae]